MRQTYLKRAMKPTRQTDHMMPDLRSGQRVRYDGFDVLLARRAVVPPDRVLGDHRLHVFGNVFDDAGALYQVMSRGNERRRIVTDDEDRERRADWPRRTVELYGWHLHAWILMNNHDPWCLETPEPNRSAGTQHRNGSYTSYFNRRHRRRGHVFQGRYKPHLIENEGHDWEVSRYILLNPARAKLVYRPEDWPWGSYRGCHRASRRVPWVTYERVLNEFVHAEAPARPAVHRRGRFVTAVRRIESAAPALRCTARQLEKNIAND